MFALLLALSTAHAEAPVRIAITDPQVTAVIFRCGSAPANRVPVREGRVHLDVDPGACQLEMERKAGTIQGAGSYSCDLNTCKLDDVHHRAVSDAPGRVNLIFTTDILASTIELTCPSGHRARGDIAENTVVFDGVPVEDGCKLSAKNGSPSRFNNISEGTWYCSTTGTTMVCKKQ